jgi:hypothetical protein
MADINDNLNFSIKDQEKLQKLIESNTKSLGGFISAQGRSMLLSEQTLRLETRINKQKTETKKVLDETQKLIDVQVKKLKDVTNLSEKEKKEAIAEKKILLEKQKIVKQNLADNEALLITYKKNETLVRQSIVNWKSLGAVVKNEFVAGIKSGWTAFSNYDREIRKTQVSMGILSTQAQGFSFNMLKASTRTQLLGVNTKDLAEFQRKYSEEIGKTVSLSEEGLIAFSEMSKGTGLGADGAAQFTVEMERLGKSTSSARDILQETVDIAQKYGTNATATSKNMMTNMRMSTKFRFKDGVKDMEDMAATSAKFKMNIEAISGFADKLFTPEGAIDASAQLQVLGGQWAKLADPFKLMYQARHDIKGLNEAIIEATKGTAQFNKESGLFEISGMEMHRLREVAKATGMQYDDLANSAMEVAKASKIQGKISATIDPKYYKFITSVSQFNKDGSISLNLFDDGKVITKLSELDNNTLKKLTEQKETLAERGKQAQAFDDIWTNIKETFKDALLPFLKGVQDGLREPLEKFIKWASKDGKDLFGKIFDLAKSVGEFVSGIGKLIVNNPFTSLVTAITAMGLFKAGTWILNGVNLGLGFKSVVGGEGGWLSKLLSKPLTGFSDLLSKETGSQLPFSSTMGRGLMTGGGVALAGQAIGGINSFRDNPNDTTGHVIQSASHVVTGAGIGGMIGTALSPLTGGLSIPIGYGLGAGAGLLYDRMNGVNDYSNKGSEPVAHDYIMRPGQKAQPFDKADTLFAYKSGGPVEQAMSNKNNNSTNITHKHEFGDINISGDINLSSKDGNTKFNIHDDPLLKRELASIIQTELRKSIGGGIMNSNPINSKTN